MATPGYNPALPSILCLHGGGTNSMIFKIQLVRLTRMLAKDFNFVFVTAPFESGPGPEVLPTFDGCGPFTRWTKMSDDLHEDAREIIEERLEEGRDGEFVGVMGFSQGAKLAAGLLLEQQVKGRVGEGFRFGVFLNGTCPPLTSKAFKEEMGDRNELITTLGLHVVGFQDRWRDESRRLCKESFDPKTSKLLEFDVGHRLPILDADTKKIANEILRMHRETSLGGY